MKTRSLKTILMSAYLSAMLASSVTPLPSDATLAGAIDPMAAQKALQSAVSGLDTAGWMVAAAGQTPAAQATGSITPITAPAKNDPVINEELMRRLITRTLASKKDFAISAETCAIFGIGEAGKDLPAKQVSEPVPEGKHLFMVPLQDGSKDVVIGFKTATTVELYLTDRTGVLRAAAVGTGNGLRLITNEQAAARYKAEMQLFAKLAQDLPPSGISVASNG